MTGKGSVGRTVTGLFGVMGCILCLISMVIPVVGAIGSASAAAGMASMGRLSSTGPQSAATPSGPLGFLLHFGPEILGVSILLVALSLGLRQKILAVPALAAGALLFWGMYGQRDSAMMYTTLGVAFAVWATLYVKGVLLRSRKTVGSQHPTGLPTTNSDQ